MSTYYTEYPTGEFEASSDEEAKSQSQAALIYKESESPDGLPFIMVRVPEKEKGQPQSETSPFK